MNFDFAAWLTKAKSYYEGLEGRQRRNLWMISIIAVVMLIILLSVFLNPNYETVFSNLDATSAGQITQKLEQMKVPYQLQGDNIAVPASQADQVRVDMAMDGLPSTGNIDYSQIFQGNTFGLSDQELNLQVLNVLQNRLAQSIESINGIESAQVNIVMPQQQTFIDPTQDLGAKASVLVTVGPGATLAPEQVGGITELVAHAVQGLSASAVTVVDQYGNDLSTATGSSGGQSTGASGPAAQELALQTQIQQTLQNQLQSSLVNMVGPGNVSVLVHANVSFNQVATQSHIVQAGPPLSSQANSTSSTGGNAGAGTSSGGVAGQATQNPNLVTYGSSGGSGQATSSNRSSTTNYDNSYRNTTVTGQPMQVQGYTVSVLVNSRAVTLTKALKQSLQSYVLTAIGQRGSTTQSPIVTVLGTPFVTTTGVNANGSTSFPGGPIGLAVVAALLLGAGGAVVLVRRSRRRRQLTSEAIDSLSKASSLANSFEESPEAAVTRQLKDLALRRPEAFAALLRSWLTEE
ncbi:MAG: flagellar basal-body MS-ring/collar protein FliF [Firmicutes bacterium]|nr:flagellar basal-body MS-ring/collar protein FliF [Bacillota bacterium]